MQSTAFCVCNPLTLFRHSQGPVDKFVGPDAEAAADEDTEAIAQAHINALAGACLAIGIKYAGSANAAACGLLTHYCAYFQRAKHRAPDSMSGDALARVCNRAVMQPCWLITFSVQRLRTTSLSDTARHTWAMRPPLSVRLRVWNIPLASTHKGLAKP